MSQNTPNFNEREIYVAAARLADEVEREAFLLEACGGRNQLKERIDRLLEVQSVDNHLLKKAVRDLDSELPDRESGTRTGEDSPTFCESLSDQIDLQQQPMVGRFQLIKAIGQGGMGTVYLAEQTDPVKRSVAVKVINPGMDSREVLARFEAERQALALMDHPNIARVFDGGTTESGRPYFVMELVQGVPLSNYCRDNKLDLGQRLRLFMDVCRAVQHAHQKGIIHRDLKPSNILVSTRDDRPIVKVIDFGVAKALHSELTDKTLFTQFSVMIGTPVYMSPEQARLGSMDVDTRSDIYSLGVILYELLTGTTPFDRKTLKRVGIDEFRKLISEEDPQRPSSRISTMNVADTATVRARRSSSVAPPQGTLDRELDWIALKALSKDRELRYESATAFADDIGRFLNGDAVTACPPTLGYRFRKWSRRNRYALAAGAAAVAVLVFVTGMSLWQVRQVNEAWQASQTRERQAMDLLDASQLQSAISAFRQTSFQSIPDLLRQPPGNSPRSSQKVGDRYFHELLIDAARPAFDRESLLLADACDIARDRSNDCVWALDAEGRFYRCDGWHTRGVSSEGFAEPVGSIEQPACSLAVSPDGKTLAIGTSNGKVSLWSIGETCSETRCVDVGANSVETITWSDDGKHLAAGTRYEGFWVGQANGDTLFARPNDHRHESFIFLPDGEQLLVPTRSGVDVYSLAKGTRTRKISTGSHKNPRELVLAGRDQRWLLVSSRFAESILIVDVANGKQLGTISIRSRYPQSLAVWQQGRRLAALMPNGLLQVFRLSEDLNGKVNGTTITSFKIVGDQENIEPNDRLRVMAADAGDHLISSGPGRQVRRWNFGRILPVQTLRPPSPIHAAFPIARDELALFFMSGHSYPDKDCDRAMPRGLGKPASRRSGEAVSESVLCYSRHLSRQGWVAFAGYNCAGIYDLRTGRVVRTIVTPLEAPSRVEISQNGNAIAVGATETEGVMAWYSDDGWETYDRPLETLVDVFGILCFAQRDGETTLLWDDRSNSVQRLNFVTGEREVFTERVDQWYTAATTSSDGSMLAVGHRDELEILDLQTRETRFRIGGLSLVCGLAFMPGDRILLSGHESGQVDAWHLPTGQALGTLITPRPELGAPKSIFTFPDCHRLLILYHNPEFQQAFPLIVGTDASMSSHPRPVETSLAR